MAEIDRTIDLNVRVQNQLARNKDVLPAAALDEYREALRIYREVKDAAGGKR